MHEAVLGERPKATVEFLLQLGVGEELAAQHTESDYNIVHMIHEVDDLTVQRSLLKMLQPSVERLKAEDRETKARLARENAAALAEQREQRQARTAKQDRRAETKKNRQKSSSNKGNKKGRPLR